MLRFFRINDPYRLLGVLFLLVMVCLPLFIDPAALTIGELKNALLGEAISSGQTMYVEVYDDTPPLAAAFFGLTDLIFGRSYLALQMVAFLILFFQAAYFAMVLINNKAYEENTYLPALIFGLLALLSFDFVSFSAELLASTFLLFTLNNLFKEIEFRVQRDETVLNIGLTLGLASLLVFSYALFLPAVIFLLAAFARLSVRKVLLLMFGFILPHGFLTVLYLSWGNAALLWQHFYLPNFVFSKQALISWGSLFFIGAVPLAYFLFSLIMLNRVARFTRYQSQLLQVLFIWMAPCAMVLIFTKELTPHSLLVLLPTLTYFITHYFLLIRRRWISEIMLWLFVGSLISICLLSRYNHIGRIDYSGLFVSSKEHYPFKGKKVTVLSNDLSVYRDNVLGGYFLNWKLSKDLFENLMYYENVIVLNNAFQSNPPDVIIDKSNLMEGVLKRIPSLRKQYRKEGDHYIRISS